MPRRSPTVALGFPVTGPTRRIHHSEALCGVQFIRIDVLDPSILDTPWYLHTLRCRLLPQGGIFLRGAPLP